MKWTPRTRLAILLATLAVIGLVTVFGPVERTLGVNLQLVILHGAWVWSGMIVFGAASASGLVALILQRPSWHGWSRALGHTGMIFWLSYLPMSMLVMQLNWGGMFFDEPRWRVPFTFAVIGVLLQAGLFIVNRPWLTSAGNLLFGVVLLWNLGVAENILHPDSPVSQSGSIRIQIFFITLLVLTLVLGAQIALWIRTAYKKE